MPFDVPTFDTNKTVVEKNVSHFENKKTIEEQENNIQNIILERIKQQGSKEIFSAGIEVKKMDNNVFLLTAKDTLRHFAFVNNEGNLLINLSYRKDSAGIKNQKNGNPGKAMIKAGFVFGENLELHKIVGYKNGSLIIGGKVDTNSIEYYQAWKKIIRSSGDIFVNTILNSDSKTKFHHNSFNALLNTGTVTKEILEKINDKGIITKEDYQFGLDFLKKQEEQEKNKTHIDEAIENINSRLNLVTIEMP